MGSEVKHYPNESNWHQAKQHLGIEPDPGEDEGHSGSKVFVEQRQGLPYGEVCDQGPPGPRSLEVRDPGFCMRWVPLYNETLGYTIVQVHQVIQVLVDNANPISAADDDWMSTVGAVDFEDVEIRLPLPEDVFSQPPVIPDVWRRGLDFIVGL